MFETLEHLSVGKVSFSSRHPTYVAAWAVKASARTARKERVTRIFAGEDDTSSREKS
jgi:hypothetical protein